MIVEGPVEARNRPPSSATTAGAPVKGRGYHHASTPPSISIGTCIVP